jgi:hypothetical protein
MEGNYQGDCETIVVVCSAHISYFQCNVLSRKIGVHLLIIFIWVCKYILFIFILFVKVDDAEP